MATRPLRIAFLLPTFPELSNTFVLAQITGLLDRGHEVDLFAISRKPFAGAQPDVARYGLASRMRHLAVPRAHAPRLFSALRLMAGQRGRHPAMWDALNPRRHGRLAWNLVRLHTAASFLRAGDYDVLHCQFGDHGPAAARLVALGATRARLVTSFRGADLTVHLARHPAHFRELFRVGALFLPVSRDFRERLIAVGAPRERVLVHHSGIDLRRFAYAPRRAPEGATRLLFVGRLTEKKGLVYALDAAAAVHANGRDVELTVVGQGPLLGPLRARAAELGISDRVRFLGARTHDEVVSLMSASHLLLAPSVTAAGGDQEGIPNVVKEAMATGMPVIATYHSGIPELVEDGVSGLLVPERDTAALAERLAFLLDHPERWPQFSRAARAAVEADFDAERLNDLLVERYRTTMDAVAESNSTAQEAQR